MEPKFYTTLSIGAPPLSSCNIASRATRVIRQEDDFHELPSPELCVNFYRARLSSKLLLLVGFRSFERRKTWSPESEYRFSPINPSRPIYPVSKHTRLSSQAHARATRSTGHDANQSAGIQIYTNEHQDQICVKTFFQPELSNTPSAHPPPPKGWVKFWGW